MIATTKKETIHGHFPNLALFPPTILIIGDNPPYCEMNLFASIGLTPHLYEIQSGTQTCREAHCPPEDIDSVKLAGLKKMVRISAPFLRPWHAKSVYCIIMMTKREYTTELLIHKNYVRKLWHDLWRTKSKSYDGITLTLEVLERAEAETFTTWRNGHTSYY